MSELRELPPASIERPAAERCSAVPTWFVAATTLLLSALREIFDEAAFSRFLARNGMTACPRTYAAFLREQEGIKARRPKCC